MNRNVQRTWQNVWENGKLGLNYFKQHGIGHNENVLSYNMLKIYR